ncbi:MAG: hypothetical protein WAV89_15215 [Ignavibacteriaceae bacterium]
MKIFLFPLFVLVAFYGCTEDNGVDSTEIQKVWVSQFYSGGIQCDASSSYQPPNVTNILGDAKIAVFETKIEMYAVCAACGCPSYAAMHYALIKETDLQKATELGFTQKEPS